MTQEGALPPDFWQQIDRRIDQKVANASRAASIRNASISSGGTFSITGGAFVLKADDGTTLFYLGPVSPSQLDGSAQPGWGVSRADGTTVLSMYDAFPGVGGVLNQALNWFDRNGNVVLADDTNSGQGIARPYIGGSFHKSRQTDWGVTTTSSTFETLFHQYIYKQQPRLEVGVMTTMDTTATTGELRVMVDGVQLGSTTTEGFAFASRYFNGVVAGSHMQVLDVQIQGRRTSATGALRVEPMYWLGKQS